MIERIEVRDEGKKVQSTLKALQDTELLHRLAEKDLQDLEIKCPVCPGAFVMRNSQDIDKHIQSM